MKYRSLFLWVICFLLFGSGMLLAQEPSYRVFETREGLINENVYYAFQDEEGFIWFGTEGGVSKFDGEEFENFTTQDGLSDNDVLTIHPDSKGRLWFLTYSGQPTCLQDGVFYASNTDSSLTNFPMSTYLSTYLNDREGNVWIVSDNSGGMRISPKGEVQHYADSSFIKTIAMFQAPDGSYYIVKYHAIQNVSMQEGNPVFGPEDTLTKMNYRACQLSSGKVLTTAENGVFELDLESGSVTQIPIERPWSGQVICLQQDQEGDLWVGTWNGVYRFPNSQLDSQNYEYLLPGKAVSSVLIDHEGNYWFTTMGAGVFFTPNPDFRTYGEDNGLPANKVTTLAIDPQGQLVMGFSGNKYAFLTDTGVKVGAIPSSLSRDQVNAFAWDDQGRFMIGADVYFALLERNQPTLRRIGTKCILYEDDDHVYVGGPGRLFYFFRNPFLIPPKKWETMFIERDSTYFIHVTNFTTFALLKDSQGRIWAGTTKGLYRVNGAEATPYGKDIAPLRTRIQDLAETPEGDVLVATHGRGLALIKPDTILHWDKRQGLAGNICKSVTVDEKGQVWLGTDRGLTKLARDSISGEYQIAQSFTHLDGLASDVVNDVMVYKDQVCVATPNGLTLLPSAQLVQPQAPPFIHLTRFEAGDSVIPPGISPKIRYRDRNLTFTFRGIQFRSPKKLGYRYRMKGNDEDWHYTQNNQINYLETPPGTYTFFVEAVLPGGIISRETEEVSFQVMAPLWRRGWLIVLEVLLFLLLIGGTFWLAVKQIKNRERKKAEIDRKIAESELKALQAQMNPHFIFNALNSIQRFILKNDPDAAYHHLERFGALMRMILENSKRKFITLEDELETLRLYLELESLRFEEQFTYHIEIGDDLFKHDILLPPMLLQPYVENAILHGLTPKESPGKLEIRFEREQQHLRVIIEDDGIGREASDQLKSRLRRGKRKSTGLVNTAERIRQLTAHDAADYTVEIIDLKDKDHVALGTRVVVRIPLNPLKPGVNG